MFLWCGQIHYVGKWEGGWALEMEFFAPCEMASSQFRLRFWFSFIKFIVKWVNEKNVKWRKSNMMHNFLLCLWELLWFKFRIWNRNKLQYRVLVPPRSVLNYGSGSAKAKSYGSSSGCATLTTGPPVCDHQLTSWAKTVCSKLRPVHQALQILATNLLS